MIKSGRKPSAQMTDWAPFFDAVDEVVRTKDFSALKKLYSKSRRTRERSLMQATARELAKRLEIIEPWWARHPMFLLEPYFVSGIENLKAISIAESPLEFKRNNIFVLGNFLSRV